jgi:UDP-glucose 4-epimerase
MPRRNLRIAVSGSSGFIGRSLIQALRRRNFVVFELSSSNDVDSFFQGQNSDLKLVDHIFWIGSKITPANADSNPEVIFDEISQLDQSLKKLKNHNPEVRFTFLSSAGAIYTGNDSPYTEGSESLGYNTYGKFKKMQEELILGEYPFTSLALRASNLYGPGQRIGRGQGVIAEWMNSALKNTPLQVFGSLSVKRDFIFIEDLIEAFLITLEKELYSNEVFNVVSGQINSLDDVKAILERSVERKLNVDFLGSRQVDRQEISISPEKFQTYFNWAPRFDLKSGLQITWERMNQA